MENTYVNVCSEVVAHNNCVGCGICVWLCPKKRLKMVFSKYGEYEVAQDQSPCPDWCRVCLNVCPFSDKADNEDILGKSLYSETPTIRYAQECGYYLESFVGYSCIHNHRENGASGGVATWILEALLRENIVDKVICVREVPGDEKLFQFTVCSTDLETRQCSRSCYYPVELSEVIERILHEEGRYVVTGVPCFIKGLRLAMKSNKLLSRRIQFLVGLICAQNKGKGYAEYLCALHGGDPHHIRDINFRVKTPHKAAVDYGTRIISGNGNTADHEMTTFLSDGAGQIWNDRYFTLNPCNYCDDIFSELADVSLMDAWLPEYSRDSRGTNLVIVRHPVMMELIKNGIEQRELSLSTIDISNVIQSQKGVVNSKRKGIWLRIHLAQVLGLTVPKKRNNLLSEPSLKERRLIKAAWKISLQSRLKWVEAGKKLAIFQSDMKPDQRRLDFARRVYKILNFPNRVICCLGRRLAIFKFHLTRNLVKL